MTVPSHPVRGRLPELAVAPLVALLIATTPFAAVATSEGTASRADVRLRETMVFPVQVGLDGVGLDERARAASQALVDAHEDDASANASVEFRGDRAVIRVGKVVVIELATADVQASHAADLATLATSTAGRIDRALRTERRRADLSDVVFRISLAVLSGLVAWLVIRKLGELGGTLAGRIRNRRADSPAFRLRGVEVVSATGVSGALLAVLHLGRVLLQATVAYSWVVFVLSLSPATRGTGLQLLHVVLGPAASTLARLGGAIPSTVAAVVAGIVLWVALHTIRLFFGSVARGETHLQGVPAELAEPLGQLAQIVIVILAAVFAAPVLAGTGDGVLAGLGYAALLAVGLAAAVPLASVAVGLPRVLGRSYRIGHVAELGRAAGVVRSVGLLAVELEDATGRRVLVPHLATLLAPTRLPGLSAAARFELAVNPSEDQRKVLEIILRTGGPGTAADLVRIDGWSATYRVAGPGADLAVRVASALGAEGVRFGRFPEGPVGVA